MKIMRGFGDQGRRGASIACIALVASCGGASGKGTLTGHLYMTGGPVPLQGAAPSPRPVSGQVVATGPAGTQTATVGADGRYTLQVPPGTYVVTGTSPNFNDGNSPCPADGKVIVVRNQTRTADVFCQVP